MFKLAEKNLTIFIVVAVLVLLVFSIIPALKPFTLNLLKLPLNFATAIGREIKGIVLYHQNYTENERLTKDVELLKNRLNSVQECKLENKRLKELLSFKQKSAYRVIPVQVIGHSADNWSSTLILDKGSNSGIKRGFAVISYLGLLGRVVEVSQSTSKVALINDPALSVSAINQRSRQEGLVCGTLGNTLVMRYLPKDADIQVSDTIVTSGLTDIYPKGLMIGAVVEVGEEFSGLSRYANIKPATDLSAIEEVLVIIP
ncbi:MAG: rod shape-determining protein MreC [Candidatus Omnitrophica bacterium]|nr:rod shape-determining protein MreC [Candidatus Omnitrophota bacterium]MDD5653043.1 rod shape-determining protein MreC [Candidatus Omnitrophota bacterium]